MNSQAKAISRSRSLLWLALILAGLTGGCAGEPCEQTPASTVVTAPANTQVLLQRRDELTRAFREQAGAAAKSTRNRVSAELAARMEKGPGMRLAMAESRKRG